MSDMNLRVFARNLRRSAEIAAEEGMSRSVVNVYNDVLKPHAEPYLVLDDAVDRAESAWARENRESIEAIKALYEPYRTARAVLLAYEPTLVLPETLSGLRTDTERIEGIEKLIDAVDDHAGTAWADDILLGPLGTKGPDVVREIQEAIAANKAVAKAREDRAKAFGPTYDRFLRFKRVVRSALGPASRQYRRIHGRSATRDDDGET